MNISDKADFVPSRRGLLKGAGVAGLAAAGGLVVGSATLPLAATPAAAMMHSGGVGRFSRTVEIGSFKVSTLLDGARTVPDPQSIFGMNVSAEEFSQVSAANFLPDDEARFYFTPTVVETGSEVVLFDTGNGGDNGNLPNALADVGLSPSNVTIVVLTHYHPDHIGGLMNTNGASFPNARYVSGSVEHNFWTGSNAPAQMVDRINSLVVPFAENMTFLEDGGSVVSGITAVKAFGHTPGHMGYMIESDGQQLMLIADLANHYVWSLAYPDWEVRFDADKEAAAASRRSVLGMLAADRVPFIGYHMPFPALGFVEANGDGFRYAPVSYQFEL